ncbi:MAG: DEAD/DEAH box helicase family protein, partial [Roseovarius sp.]
MTSEPIQLLPHQKREVAFLMHRDSGLIASSTGTGKTGTLCGLAQALIAEGHGPILWVTPTSVLKQSSMLADAFGLNVETSIANMIQDLAEDAVAMVTTSILRSKFTQLDSVEFGAVLIDEIHQGLASSGSVTAEALTTACQGRLAYG